MGALVLNGVSQPGGIYNAGSSPAYLASTGSLQVVSGPTNLMASLSGNTLLVSWPSSNYVGWILQTNAISLAVSADWHDVPGSGTNMQMLFPVNNPAITNEFFRLRFP